MCFIKHINKTVVGIFKLKHFTYFSLSGLDWICKFVFKSKYFKELLIESVGFSKLNIVQLSFIRSLNENVDLFLNENILQLFHAVHEWKLDFDLSQNFLNVYFIMSMKRCRIISKSKTCYYCVS